MAKGGITGFERDEGGYRCEHCDAAVRLDHEEMLSHKCDILSVIRFVRRGMDERARNERPGSSAYDHLAGQYKGASIVLNEVERTIRRNSAVSGDSAVSTESSLQPQPPAPSASVVAADEYEKGNTS